MNTRTRPLLALLLLCSMLTAASAFAQVPQIMPDQQLNPQTSYPTIASPVAVHGRFALLGFSGSFLDPALNGYVEIYEKVQQTGCINANCWALAGRLPTPPNLPPLSEFGAAIAFDGHTAIIGSPAVHDGDEAVYIYARTPGGWKLRQTLRSGVPGPTNFGRMVALDGETLAVASLGYGHASVLRFYKRGRDGQWRLVSTFTAPDDEQFSTGLALHGFTAMVGSGDPNVGTAKVYVFERSRGLWNRTDTLVPEDQTSISGFGSAIALNGHIAVIVDHLADPGATVIGSEGAAYVFKRRVNGWQQTHKLQPPSPIPWQQFGTSAVVFGRYVAVGAVNFIENTGTLYVFGPEGQDYVETLELRHNFQPVYLPSGIDFDGRTLMISAAGEVRWVWNLAEHAAQ